MAATVVQKFDNVPSRTRYAYMDGLRALAVLAVVIVHGFEGSALTQHTKCGFPANLGERGVDLFFVISGFCLGRPFLAPLFDGRVLRIDFGKFMIRRIARIAPPYYAALVLFVILSFTPFGYPTAFGPGVVMAGLRELPFDIVFLTSHGPFANSSFWTLGLEMRWYVLCPLLVVLFVRSRVAFAVVAVLCWVAYARITVAPGDLGLLPSFMLGIVAAWVDLHKPNGPSIRAASYLAMPVLVLASIGQSRLTYVEHGDPMWHVAFFLLLVASSRGILASVLSWSPIVAIGRASFSIYLIHMPVAFYLGRSGVPWIVASLAGLFSGYLFWLTAERYFLRATVRGRIESGIAAIGKLYPRPPLFLNVENNVIGTARS